MIASIHMRFVNDEGRNMPTASRRVLVKIVGRMPLDNPSGRDWSNNELFTRIVFKRMGPSGAFRYYWPPAC